MGARDTGGCMPARPLQPVLAMTPGAEIRGPSYKRRLSRQGRDAERHRLQVIDQGTRMLLAGDPPVHDQGYWRVR